MADTPPKPFPAQSIRTKVAWARIDPEGNVSATWRTWALIAGAIVWATMFYAEIRGLPARVDAISIEVQVHREILIKAGLLPVGATVSPGKAP
jgi:hypothetical protein